MTMNMNVYENRNSFSLFLSVKSKMKNIANLIELRGVKEEFCLSIANKSVQNCRNYAIARKLIAHGNSTLQKPETFRKLQQY